MSQFLFLHIDYYIYPIIYKYIYPIIKKSSFFSAVLSILYLYKTCTPRTGRMRRTCDSVCSLEIRDIIIRDK